ncbi:DUF3367 domain-containing protein [Gordonia sp. TBRC 11910]|uniref:DUF3367 domain-containing protein n=1 Tax=Gordonia asplenii TaxID=2725283 RepID=A0A848KW59_9ACTN|nr:alpha-(1->3)-arabinofuranosyltransferase [Gordonia asplenii]NMO02482.1 DUF3367 domain-containing protein [Gordonia asplenii]
MTPAALSRRGVAWVVLGALIASFAQSPGRLAADTKLDLTANPLGFLARAGHLWTPIAPMGQVQNQAYGYYFPHGAFYAAGELCGLPPWITQRLWWALLIVIGFVGIVRLAEAIGAGSSASRLIGATAFVLSPRVLTTLGSISSETLPMMLAPWVLIPVIRALDRDGDGDTQRPLRRLAFQSAAAVALMGAVNAVATVAACAVSVLWFAMHRPTARWARFGGWWAVGGVLACAWWVVPLLILSRVSPPFLDFIESSRVTTEWTSLTEVARGASSWTPFVSPERVAGSILVTQPAAVVATGVVTAAGFAGLSMRHMPFRRRFVTIAAVGLLLICVGYAGGLGSPVAEPIRVFLDGPGAALRNVHKWEPLVRVPVVLGIVHLLARAPLPSVVPLRKSLSALAHPERSAVVASTLVILVALLGAGSVVWTGGLAGNDTYRDLPDYWRQTARWLDQQAAGSSHPGRALVVPGSPFAQQLWGLTRDEPLQPLATTPWAVRDAIPLVAPEAIRAMDSVQRAIADGRPSAGLAATLAGQGIRYVVLRADLTPTESRSARPLLAQYALTGSPGLRRVATFGPDVGPATVDGVVVDDGLRPALPAIQIFAVDVGPRFAGTGPSLTDLDAMPRISGGPESLAALNDYRAQRGLTPLGPTLFDADRRRAGLPAAATTITDTPVDRETDFGRVDDHSSSTRAADDPRRTKNAAADYPVTGQPLVTGQWLLDNEPGQVWVTASGSASDATQPGQTSPADSPAAAFDHNPDTAWISSGLDAAVGQWLQLDFATPRADLAVTLTTHKAIGPDVTGIVVASDTGTAVAQGIKPGEPVTVTLPGGATSSIRIRALSVKGGVAGNQFALSEVGVRDLATGAPLDIRFRTDLPDVAGGTPIAGWFLTQELDSRSACVPDADVIRCSPAVGRSAETSGVFSRMLSVPSAVDVGPTVVLRARPGTDLNAALGVAGTLSATGAASVTDPRGNAMALVDGDPSTVWIAPDSRDPKARPTVVLNLPAPQRVDRLRIVGPDRYPARPTEVVVDAGDGKHRVHVGRDGFITVDSPRTQRISLTISKWSELIDVDGLGFARKAPPGIGEISVFPAVPGPGSLDRRIDLGCDRGIGVTAAGQVVRLRVSTSVRALRDGEPILATPCDGERIRLPAGHQEVSVNPTGLFSVVGVDLAGPGSQSSGPSTTRAADATRWDATNRSVKVEASQHVRVLSVPESTNAGWQARMSGRLLTPVVVDGWQQGWIVPADRSGTIELTYRFDTAYRWALGAGLALVALLFAATWWPRRGAPPPLVEPATTTPPPPLVEPGPTSAARRARVETIASRIINRVKTLGKPTPPAHEASTRDYASAPPRLNQQKQRTAPPPPPVEPDTHTAPRVLACVGVLIASWLLCGWWGLAASAVVGVGLQWVRRRDAGTQIAPITAAVAMLLATWYLAAGPWHSPTGYHGFSWPPQLLALVAVTAMMWSTTGPDDPSRPSP